MPSRSDFHAFLHRICEGTEQIRKKKERKNGGRFRLKPGAKYEKQIEKAACK